MTKLWTTAAPAFRESGDWPRQGLRSGQDRRSRPARRNLERAMAVAVVPREDNAFANDNPPPARNAVLAFCRDYLSRRPRRRHHGSRHLPRPARRRFLVALGQRDYRYRERSLRLKPAQRRRTPITLRQGARVIEDSRHLRLAWADKGRQGGL